MKLNITDDVLTINFERVECFLAAKRKIALKKTDITQATWQLAGVIPASELGWRVGGANLPKVLLAGRFVGDQGLNFVYLLQPRRYDGQITLANLLTLELRNNRYKRLLLTTKQDIADKIVSWWVTNY